MLSKIYTKSAKSAKKRANSSNLMKNYAKM
uniref:Uncharacterized protein n=1 Tax=viral metagenome TaxID=1070528 RepID=A0A6C0D4X0_9ZZZZ